MINLIPNKEKKEMVRGFYFRLLVLFFVMISIFFFIGFLAILPSYFFSSIKVHLMNSRLDIQKNTPVALPDQETLATIKDIDNKLALIEKNSKNKFIVSKQVINSIILKKIPKIKIHSISYKVESVDNLTHIKKVKIEGTAPSREVLLMFRNALQEGVDFKEVELPISNFVKGSDIQFSLNLIPA